MNTTERVPVNGEIIELLERIYPNLKGCFGHVETISAEALRILRKEDVRRKAEQEANK